MVQTAHSAEYAFSKSWDNLHAALALHFAFYNLCRIHGSLRVTPGTYMLASICENISFSTSSIQPYSYRTSYFAAGANLNLRLLVLFLGSAVCVFVVLYFLRAAWRFARRSVSLYDPTTRSSMHCPIPRHAIPAMDITTCA